MAKKTTVDKKKVAEVRERIEKRVRREFGVTAEAAVLPQIYQAAALCVRDDVMDVFAAERERSSTSGDKCVIYLCAEFLIGRALSNNLVNLGLYDTYAAALSEMGYNLGEVEEQEADAGLAFNGEAVAFSLGFSGLGVALLFRIRLQGFQFLLDGLDRFLGIGVMGSVGSHAGDSRVGVIHIFGKGSSICQLHFTEIGDSAIWCDFCAG